MSFWHTKQKDGLTLYKATTMSWLPNIVQCFTTRDGGVSKEPYNSLNLSLTCGDDASDVEKNRDILASALSVSRDSMVFGEQVHGSSVEVVDSSSDRFIKGVDALITADRGVYLTLLFADCYPIYIVEPHKKILGLAHAGWRGVDSGIIRATTERMISDFDVTPGNCQVAIGPGVVADNYEVDSSVADRFRETFVAGATVAVMPKQEMNGKYTLNLRSIIFTQLLTLGFKPASIAVADVDTFANSDQFFSHRREYKNDLQTGRMAAVLGMRPD